MLCDPIVFQFQLYAYFETCNKFLSFRETAQISEVISSRSGDLNGLVYNKNKDEQAKK